MVSKCLSTSTISRRYAVGLPLILARRIADAAAVYVIPPADLVDPRQQRIRTKEGGGGGGGGGGGEGEGEGEGGGEGEGEGGGEGGGGADASTPGVLGGVDGSSSSSGAVGTHGGVVGGASRDMLTHGFERRLVVNGLKRNKHVIHDSFQNNLFFSFLHSTRARRYAAVGATPPDPPPLPSTPSAAAAAAAAACPSSAGANRTLSPRVEATIRVCGC